ncbi:fumarate reductase subunit FrdD [Neisseria sp. Ec49-e6-T10]|uniref:fumarate reductase subunit FrdD n=1 Tax=Neisseria sp. Ec49-e6-T10 TaxID=3140744 RepID=UPI003EBBFF1B
MKQSEKRSNELIFWGMFGAGGMVSAIVAPIVIIVVAFILPFASTQTSDSIVSFAHSLIGKLFLAVVIILPLWCAFHRIHHALHDLKIHFPFSKFLSYFSCAVLSVIAVYLIIIY